MSSIRKAVRLSWNVLKTLVTNPTGLRFVSGMALWASEQVVDRKCDISKLNGVSIQDLLPEAGPPLKIEFAVFPKTRSSIALIEFLGLVLLLKKANAKTIFEFGTYKGVSITQLALNVPPDGKIYTLDLPDESAATQFTITNPEDVKIAIEKGKGSLVPADLRPRIEFLQQDSAAFDEAPYVGRMDFVFVDGAHNAAYVRNDSEKGWRMLRSGGIIAWHDCRVQDPAVVDYLLKSSFAPSTIVGTTLAFAIKP
jgi:predicted O-methyltransferase YrrM